MEILQGLGQGFSVVLSPYNLLFCVLAACLGLVLAFLPGMGPSVVMVLAMPFAFAMPPANSIIVLVALCFGLQYGRAAAAFARAGGQSAAADGLAQAGVTPLAFATLIGGAIVTILVAGLVPLLLPTARSFGPAEIAVLIIIFLVIAAALSPGSVVRAVAVIVIGLLLSIVGSELDAGVRRLSFDTLELPDGIPLLPLVLGVLLIPDIISRLQPAETAPTAKTGTSSDEQPDLLESSGQERAKRIARTAAAANVGLSASFLPMLALGIPLNVAAVVFMGVLTIHGAVPGPQVATKQPEMFWGLFAAIMVANVGSLLIMRTSGRPFSILCGMNDRIVAPAVLALGCLGAYALNNDPFDVVLMLVFGVFGSLLLKSGWERGLFLTSFVLGTALEAGIQRSLLIARGDALAILSRPMVGVLLAAGVILAVVIRVWRMNRWFNELMIGGGAWAE
jgi:TctA family transporter